MVLASSCYDILQTLPQIFLFCPLLRTAITSFSACPFRSTRPVRGAWIETWRGTSRFLYSKSHPRGARRTSDFYISARFISRVMNFFVHDISFNSKNIFFPLLFNMNQSALPLAKQNML